MPKDPVCASYVSKDTPYRQDIEGQTYYFCSSECAEEFEHNYDDYLVVEEEASSTGEW